MSNDSVEVISQVQTGLDAFLAVSNAYMRGHERLSALNAAAIRDSVIEAGRVANLLAGIKGEQDVQNIYSSLTSNLFARAASYTKDVLAIATETQASVAQLQQIKLAVASNPSKVAEIWQQTLGAIVNSTKDLAPVSFFPTLINPGNSKHPSQGAETKSR